MADWRSTQVSEKEKSLQMRYNHKGFITIFNIKKTVTPYNFSRSSRRADSESGVQLEMERTDFEISTVFPRIGRILRFLQN